MNRIQRMRSAGTAALAVIILSAAPSLAHADPADGAPRGTVRFDDLNLAKPGAVRILYTRIERAAQSVCGSSVITGTRLVSKAWTDCVNDAVRHAILNVNQPELTAYYAERLGAPPARTSAVTGR